MKNTILSMTFLTATVLLATASAATTDQGTLNLSGVVNEAVSLSITAEAVADNLDLATTQSDLLVATVTESSNTALGYDVTISSAMIQFLREMVELRQSATLLNMMDQALI